MQTSKLSAIPQPKRLTSLLHMPRNIEIKARIKSVESLLSKASAIASEGPVEIVQDDTFFACKNGRIKLRAFSKEEGELIFYQRANQHGPKESFYLRSPTSSPDNLREALSRAYGQVGRVQKHRTLFLVGRTRVHLDRVHDLGHFLELEVVLQENEPAKTGMQEAHKLMLQLGVETSQLIEGAYVDLLNNASAQLPNRHEATPHARPSSPMFKAMKVLAISGSLRAASVNSALLRATARLAPNGMDVHVYPGLGALPLFNPDLEANAPFEVTAFREAVDAADALIFASPEYAHGVTGVIKNALDWLVSFEPFANKPVALFSASPRSAYANPALRETLQTMSASIVDSACFASQLVGAQMSEDEMVCAPAISSEIKAALAALKAFPDGDPAGRSLSGLR